MGQFNFKQIGLYGRPIYQNSGGRYLFYSDFGQWLVSLTNVNMSCIKSLILRLTQTYIIYHNSVWFDLFIKQVGPNYNDTEYAELRQEKCVEECPATCSNQWSYFKRSRHPIHTNFAVEYFAVDTSLNVSCGKNSITLHLIVYTTI